MIGCLQGKIFERSENKVLVLTPSGVGYEVFLSSKTSFSAEPNILLYTSNIIKETSNELYGFISKEEKTIFELLISVKGVGPKSAFSMVSTIGPREIVQAILLENKKILCSAPGIGKKAASQIVLDLSEKISNLSSISSTVSTEVNQQEAFSSDYKAGHEKFLSEAIMACKELGFKETEISSLASRILGNDEITSSEQLIHQVLKEL